MLDNIYIARRRKCLLSLSIQPQKRKKKRIVGIGRMATILSSAIRLNEELNKNRNNDKIYPKVERKKH